MRGMVFDADSVAAIIAGRKTQTRRVVAFDLTTAQAKVKHAGYYPQAGEVVYIKERYYTKHGMVSYDPPQGDSWVAKNPRYMPQTLARFFVQVTATKLEHIQNISDDDIAAEGVLIKKGSTMYEGKLKLIFAKRWDALNAERGYGWDKNPVVRVYKFHQVTL